MKKTIICISVIIVLIVGTLSVSALSKSDESKINEIIPSTYENQELKKTDSSLSIEKLNTQKDIIFNNILNCIDFYNEVSGTIETTFIDSNPVEISYDVNIPEQLSFQTVKGINLDLEIFCQDNKIVESNNIAKQYSEEIFVSQLDSKTRKKLTANINEKVTVQPYYNYDHVDVSSQRVRKNSTGEMEYYYRPDLTNAGLASVSIYPQNLVFGFMSDINSWNITGTEKYLNRQAIIVKGETINSDYAKKLKVNSFEMKFDQKTGILLDFKGYESDGTLTQYLTTTEIRVEKSNAGLSKSISNSISSLKSKYDKK